MADRLLLETGDLLLLEDGDKLLLESSAAELIHVELWFQELGRAPKRNPSAEHGLNVVEPLRDISILAHWYQEVHFEPGVRDYSYSDVFAPIIPTPATPPLCLDIDTEVRPVTTCTAWVEECPDDTLSIECVVSAVTTISAVVGPCVHEECEPEDIAPPPATLRMVSVCPVSHPVIGVPYSATFTVSGGVGPFVWSVSGLPSGIALTPTSSRTGVISGTVMGGGQFPYIVTVTDNSGQQVILECVFEISLPLLPMWEPWMVVPEPPKKMQLFGAGEFENDDVPLECEVTVRPTEYFIGCRTSNTPVWEMGAWTDDTTSTDTDFNRVVSSANCAYYWTRLQTGASNGLGGTATPGNAIDGDPDTYAEGRYTAYSNIFEFRKLILANIPAPDPMRTVVLVTFSLDAEIDVNGGDGEMQFNADVQNAGGGAPGESDYSLNDGLPPTVGSLAVVSFSDNVARTVYSFTINAAQWATAVSNGQDAIYFRVWCFGSGSNQFSAPISLKVYDATVTYDYCE